MTERPAPSAGLEVDVDLQRGRRVFHLGLRSAAATIGVVGPSGAGKSTLLRVLAGLEPRARGRVVLGDTVFQDSPGRIFLPAWRRRVGWVPQDATLLPHRSVHDNLGWAGASSDEIAAIADELGIAGLLDRRPRNLSGGERQRVAIGRALLARPRLLLLDEPFSALDRDRRAGVIGVVGRKRAALGATLVLVTHDEADVAALCDEVWEVRDRALVRVDRT